MENLKFTDVSIEEVLSYYTVKEIKKFADQIWLKVPSGIKKARLVKYVSSALLTYPSWLIKTLFVY